MLSPNPVPLQDAGIAAQRTNSNPLQVISWPSIQGLFPKGSVQSYMTKFEAQQRFLPETRFTLDTPDQIDHYLKSFREHLHVLYPIVNGDWLETSMQRVKQGHMVQLQRPGTGQIEHPSYAVLQLVLALGAICDHPNPLPPSKMKISDQPLTNIDYMRPLHKGQGAVEVVNMGLSRYYAAVGVLDDNPGYHDLLTIQGRLLAGLYALQFAQTSLAFHHISIACTSCQILISTGQYKLTGSLVLMENIAALTFWSCTDLEREVSHAAKFPRTGISKHESRVPFPDCQALASASHIPYSAENLELYKQRIWLRRTLDQVTFYTDADHLSETLGIRAIHSSHQMLKSWRTSTYAWRDNDSPSSDIVVATMRANYYNALQTIYRPVVEAVLFHSARVPLINLQYYIEGAIGTITAFNSIQTSIYVPNFVTTAHV
jgi:hypothetical protein